VVARRRRGRTPAPDDVVERVLRDEGPNGSAPSPKETTVSLPLASEPAEFPWPEEIMTVAQVAAVVKMTPKTVRLHIRRGRLRAVQFEDGPYRVRREDAQSWIEAQLVVPDAGALAVDRHIARTAEPAEVALLTSGRRRRPNRLPQPSDLHGSNRVVE
jgi:excisionase family DNA binding protein